MRGRLTQCSVVGMLILALGALVMPASTATPGAQRIATDRSEQPKVVQIHVDDRAELDRLVATGTDVVEFVKPTQDGLVTEVVVTPSELARLESMGFEPGEVVFTVKDWKRNLAERSRFLDEQGPVEDNLDTVKIIRADYFQNSAGSFLSLEAKSSLGNATGVQLLARWSDPANLTTLDVPATMSAFIDVGQYMYHRLLVPVAARPATVTVQSTRGGSATAAVDDWLGATPPEPKPHYVSDFVDHYMDPTEVYDRIEELAAQYPEIAEIVKLPHQTNGYRRKAQVLLGNGSAAASAVVVTSAAWGHEGGNDLRSRS